MSNEIAVLEPSLSEMFKEPIIQMLMKKDGVSKTDLLPILKDASQKMKNKGKLEAA